MQLNRYAIAFFGTIFCSSTRINDKIQAYEQFVVVLENDEDEELKARLKPLNETFDRFYPLAVLT
jgi:hypothetical protein